MSADNNNPGVPSGMIKVPPHFIPDKPCEQALAAVPPPDVALLAAELMSEPAGMKEKRRRGRPKGKHCDPPGDVLASKATERAYRLLAACYHEKQRRLKTSRYIGLASLSLTAIARIALVRIWAGESLEESVSTAITLLEVAECGQLGLGTEDSYLAGIDRFLKGKRADQNFQEEVAHLPKVTCRCDEHGRKLLEPFEAGLRILIPLGDRWKSRAGEKRNASFKAFLIEEIIRPERPKFTTWRLAKEAETQIDEMKRCGIPRELFRAAVLWFHHWRRKDISAARRIAGKKGRERSPFRKAKKVAE